jgi:hypothetical protein
MLAAGPINELNRLVPTIRVESIATAFYESGFAQFKRGFSGIDPQRAIAIVGQTTNREAAVQGAAAIELFVDCSIQGKLVDRKAASSEGVLREQGLSSQTTVISNGSQFFVLTNLGSPRVALGYLNFLRDDIDVSHVTVISGSNGPYEIKSALSDPKIGTLPPQLVPMLLSKIQPNCEWRGDQFGN